jgi:hypothetical protein
MFDRLNVFRVKFKTAVAVMMCPDAKGLLSAAVTLEVRVPLSI